MFFSRIQLEGFYIESQWRTWGPDSPGEHLPLGVRDTANLPWQRSELLLSCCWHYARLRQSWWVLDQKLRLKSRTHTGYFLQVNILIIIIAIVTKYLQADVEISSPSSPEFNYKGTHRLVSKMTSFLMWKYSAMM